MLSITSGLRSRVTLADAHASSIRSMAESGNLQRIVSTHDCQLVRHMSAPSGGEVTLRQVHRGHNGLIHNPNLMVLLVWLSNTAQDGNRLFGVRLLDHDLFESDSTSVSVLPGDNDRLTAAKRRSRAPSFSICSRYSARVVAPMQRNCPRANAGLRRFAASLLRRISLTLPHHLATYMPF